MNLPYIITVALIITACLSFYKVLLRRETFYRMNRYLLVGCLVVAFTLPLLPIPQEFSLTKQKAETKSEIRKVAPLIIVPPLETTKSEIESVEPAGDTNNLSQSAPLKFSFEQLIGWMVWIYWFGVFVFAAAFLLQLALLLYRSWCEPAIKDGQYRIVDLPGNRAPCSFGNTIFINPSLYDWETYNQILLHEKIHIRQKHTIDILMAELVLIFQWFNPFAWIYRREIENNLEFLTDDELMQHQQVDKKKYQLSLVRVSAPHLPLSLTNNYNQSILKKRITMMNRKRSSFQTTWKYLFLLPLLAFLACLLNEPTANSQTTKPKNEKNVKIPVNARVDVNTQNEQQVQTKIDLENAINIQTEQATQTQQSIQGLANVQAQAAVQSVINVQNNINTKISTNTRNKVALAMEKEGYWFAVIKGDKVNIRFSDEKPDDEGFSNNHYGGNTFKLSDLGNIPRDTEGTFSINREAGKMEMKGKFEGNTGMGTYKFIADKAYFDYMSKELDEKVDEDEQLAFFFIDIKKDYLQMLKNEGFKTVEKDNIISMAAMGIDAAYIKSIRAAGFKDVDMDELVSSKALKVDAAYIKEIRDAGYKDIDLDQLVAFKAQGIDSKYINEVKTMKGGKVPGDADDLVGMKAMNVDAAFINSFKAVGYNNIPHEQLVSFKAVGVTPEYIKGWQAQGYKNIDAEDLVGMKSQNVTPEYMKGFASLGYKNVKPEDLVSFKAVGVTPEYIKGWQALGYKNIDAEDFVGMKAQNVTPEYVKGFTNMGYKNVKPEDFVGFKALGITPEYIKTFEAAGYKDIDFDNLPALKSQGVTPEFIKSFEALGFKNISLEEIVAVKAVGVTPEYIKDMRAKGFNYNSLQKYVTLKSID